MARHNPRQSAHFGLALATVILLPLTILAQLQLGDLGDSGPADASGHLPTTSAVHPDPLSSYIASVVATIPPQWKVPHWWYAIVTTTPNAAMGDTWGPSGSAPPYSKFSRSQMNLLMGTAGGRQAITMVVLHEAMNALAYSVVDQNSWSGVPGWPGTFASEVVPRPGYDDIDAAANCLELGALSFTLNPSSGYTEDDMVGGCSPTLATWLTRHVASALHH
jgi:hypothetical protein